MYSFWDAFGLQAIVYTFVGAGLGIIWGAMPGLSMTMGMALLAQFSYAMSVYDACAFLMGVYTGAVFGGTISAILLNIPGTPDSVPVQIAGYPLTRQGRGGEALGTAVAASFIGNWVGILILVAVTPVALAFAMRFGSWEQFLLALWGIMIAGSLSGEGDSAIKGWISGWIGLAIAMVGIEPIHGYARMTFGELNLISGIAFIPALIGLFGIAEVMRVARNETLLRTNVKLGSVVPRLRTLVKYALSALRSSALGTFFGAIPGGGAPMATFMAYDLGQRFSGKDFSKGSIEGVVCTSTADNATIGGSLLPTMSLGIPGTAAAAVFMAALAFHGVIVGPAIEQSRPGFMQFLYGALIVANFAMYILAFALIKPSLYALSTPQSILMPLVSVFCIVGAFALNLSSFDMSVALVFGVVGYVLYHWGFPLAPMVFAMILGGMADENLRKALIIYSVEGYLALLSRPLGNVILLCIGATLFFGIRSAFANRNKPLADGME